MKMIFIDHMKRGMVIAEDIFALDNIYIPLVKKDTVLTEYMLDELRTRGIRFAYVKERPTRIAEAPAPMRHIYVAPKKPIISNALRKEALDSLEEAFDIGYNDIHESSARILHHLDNVVEELVDSLLKDPHALVNINDIKSYDEYTFHHSLSVALLSLAVAQYCGFNKQALHKIGMCAIMHDIGKTAVPIEIIQKTSRLDENEFSIIKTHSPAGYDFLMKSGIADDELLKGVLYHHERFDGTGYPEGLKSDEIPLFSRIISVADVYDALTSNRPYRKPMQPAEAIEYIMGGVGVSFDYDSVYAFLHKVELYPVGTSVELSNGKIAVVVNNESQLRPVVRTVAGELLDLYRDRKCLNIVIKRLLPA